MLVLAIFAAIIGSAQAANSTKPYSANVHRTLNTPGSFTLTVTNDPKAQQSLGSGNFTPPPGFQAGTVSNVQPSSGWTVSVDSAGIVEFRANSSATALSKGQSVSADVAVTIPSQCSANTGTSSATWQVEAKQSNDFSGQPGNSLNLSAGSDLTPLGSFVFAPIETVVTTVDPALHVPQILTNAAAPIGITAKDTCGNADSDYTGGTLVPKVDLPPRLVNATLTGLGWSGGGVLPRTGSATLTPVDVEAADHVVVTDAASGINATSNSFDVVEKICAVAGTLCTWQNKNKTINATSTVPGDSGGTASLGLGFRSLTATCTIPGVGPVSSFGDGVQINPVNYTGPYQVTLTYAKSLTGNGPASSFHVCLSDDNGLTWFPIPQCPATPVATCADPKRVSGGALQIILYLAPGDPLSGGF